MGIKLGHQIMNRDKRNCKRKEIKVKRNSYTLPLLARAFRNFERERANQEISTIGGHLI